MALPPPPLPSAQAQPFLDWLAEAEEESEEEGSSSGGDGQEGSSGDE